MNEKSVVNCNVGFSANVILNEICQNEFDTHEFKRDRKLYCESEHTIHFLSVHSYILKHFYKQQIVQIVKSHLLITLLTTLLRLCTTHQKYVFGVL